MDTCWLFGDLVISSYQIQLGEDAGVLERGREALDVWYAVSVGNGNAIQCAVICTGAPIVRCFYGTMCSGDGHALDEGRTMPNWSMFSNSCQVTRRRSGARRLGRAETGGPDVMM